GTTNDLAPARTARVIAAARPRALKEPIGLVLSSFTQNWENPCFAASRGVDKSGVPPSPRGTGCSPSPRGSHSRYRHLVQPRVARTGLAPARGAAASGPREG